MDADFGATVGERDGASLQTLRNPANGFRSGATDSPVTNRQYQRRAGATSMPDTGGGTYSAAKPEVRPRTVPKLQMAAKRAGAGREVPDGVGLVSLHVTSVRADWSRVEQHSDEIGLAATDLLFPKLHADERGVPALPRPAPGACALAGEAHLSTLAGESSPGRFDRHVRPCNDCRLQPLYDPGSFSDNDPRWPRSRQSRRTSARCQSPGAA